MGKLHKLRRTILRDPSKWEHYSSCGAHYWKGEWRSCPWGHPYRSFVRSVLNKAGVGKSDNGQGGVAPDK